jgi:aryl-alcohol dehydrogenase-like predicted oxidoreductase
LKTSQMRTKQANLVLGTAQLGAAYGAANAIGVVSEAGAVDLVQAATNAGIRDIDTARAYGDAERRVGLALQDRSGANVVTKLSPLADVPPGDAAKAVAAAEASLAASRQALGRNTLQTFLLHRAAHRLEWNGAVWRLLVAERKRGGIEKLGVSVQTPAEALAALADPDVVHIQMPYNLLDRRWSDVIAALRARPDLTVHVRSVLLQGLLTGLPHARWPKIPGADRDRVLSPLAALAQQLGRNSLTDLCIAFVRAQDWIDGIVIGIETLEQLERNLALFREPPLRPEECELVHSTIPALPDALLDPAQWSRAED